MRRETKLLQLSEGALGGIVPARFLLKAPLQPVK